ncbi:MAG: response regulator, partial [Cyclobacteriaceae bacterium]|nr:response regulator [Cyclobacteriaceae bacterium]
MIKTLIIDDEPLATEIIKEYLSDFPQFEVIKVCHNGFDGLKAIYETQPELIFLDVQMPKLNGFELLELLDNPPYVIFTTAFDQYAMKAFDIHAIDYLLKP